MPALELTEERRRRVAEALADTLTAKLEHLRNDLGDLEEFARVIARYIARVGL